MITDENDELNLRDLSKYSAPLLSEYLEWPSLTASWINNKNEQNILIGTNSIKEEPNYLMILNLNEEIKNEKNDNQLLNENNYKIIIKNKIKHQGPVYFARNMQQINYLNIIGSVVDTGEIHIFNLNNKELKKKTLIKPDIKLKTGNTEIKKFCFSRLKEGFLLTGNSEGKVY